jgi:hypothetical protein
MALRFDKDIVADKNIEAVKGVAYELLRIKEKRELKKVEQYKKKLITQHNSLINILQGLIRDFFKACAKLFPGYFNDEKNLLIQTTENLLEKLRYVDKQKARIGQSPEDSLVASTMSIFKGIMERENSEIRQLGLYSNDIERVNKIILVKIEQIVDKHYQIKKLQKTIDNLKLTKESCREEAVNEPRRQEEPLSCAILHPASNKDNELLVERLEEAIGSNQRDIIKHKKNLELFFAQRDLFVNPDSCSSNRQELQKHSASLGL